MRRLLTLSHRGTRRAAFLPPVAAALAAAACAGPTDPGQRVILGVTRLDAPATFAAGEAFDVTLTVATGGCTRFTGIEAARAPGRLSLTAVGREWAGPGVACPDVLHLEPRTYRVAAPAGDSLVVDVVQSYDVYLGRVVRRR